MIYLLKFLLVVTREINFMFKFVMLMFSETSNARFDSACHAGAAFPFLCPFNSITALNTNSQGT